MRLFAAIVRRATCSRSSRRSSAPSGWRACRAGWTALPARNRRGARGRAGARRVGAPPRSWPVRSSTGCTSRSPASATSRSATRSSSPTRCGSRPRPGAGPRSTSPVPGPGVHRGRVGVGRLEGDVDQLRAIGATSRRSCSARLFVDRRRVPALAVRGHDHRAHDRALPRAVVEALDGFHGRSWTVEAVSLMRWVPDAGADEVRGDGADAARLVLSGHVDGAERLSAGARSAGAARAGPFLVGVGDSLGRPSARLTGSPRAPAAAGRAASGGTSGSPGRTARARGRAGGRAGWRARCPRRPRRAPAPGPSS